MRRRRLIPHMPRNSTVSPLSMRSGLVVSFHRPNLGDKLHKLAALSRPHYANVELQVDLMLKRLKEQHR